MDIKPKNIDCIKSLAANAKTVSAVNRIRILHALKIKDMCVCELSFIAGIKQPSVSRHLKRLIKAGFIGSKQNGLWTDYYLGPKNNYARNFIRNINVWLKSDKTIKKDKEKIKRADRNTLCKKQGCR